MHFCRLWRAALMAKLTRIADGQAPLYRRQLEEAWHSRQAVGGARDRLVGGALQAQLDAIERFEPDDVHWCDGNYEAYHDQRRERLGIEADQPKRFKYKRLQRT